MCRHSKGSSSIVAGYNSGMHAAEVVAPMELRMRSTKCTSPRVSMKPIMQMTVADRVAARAFAWLLVDSAAKEKGKDSSGTSSRLHDIDSLLIASLQCTRPFTMPREPQKTALPLETYNLAQRSSSVLLNARPRCRPRWQTPTKMPSPVSLKRKSSCFYCKRRW